MLRAFPPVDVGGRKVAWDTSRSFGWAVEELPSSEDLGPYPATDGPIPATPSHAMSHQCLVPNSDDFRIDNTRAATRAMVDPAPPARGFLLAGVKPIAPDEVVRDVPPLVVGEGALFGAEAERAAPHISVRIPGDYPLFRDWSQQKSFCNTSTP